MLPEEKTAILARIHFAERNMQTIISMVEAGKNYEKVLLKLQALQVALHSTGSLSLHYQIQQSIENICHNTCPEERSAEVERLVELYGLFLIYS